MNIERINKFIVHSTHPTGYYATYATLDPIDYLRVAKRPLCIIQETLPDDISNIIFTCPAIHTTNVPTYNAGIFGHKEYAEAGVKGLVQRLCNPALASLPKLDKPHFKYPPIVDYLWETYVFPLSDAHEKYDESRIVAIRRKLFSAAVHSEYAQLAIDICVAVEKKDWDCVDEIVMEFDALIKEPAFF